MSDQDPNRGPERTPAHLPPQPTQLLDRNYNFTPYYTTHQKAGRFRGHVTPHLSNNLKHPPEEFAGPRNLFPSSDPIMDARKEVTGAEEPAEVDYEEVEVSKEVKKMSDDERRACDAKEFSSSPPDALSQAQEKRWVDLFAELIGEEKTREDPHKIRARGELRKLKKLADLAAGKQG